MGITDIVIKLVVFSIILNFCTGLMMLIVPQFSLDPSTRSGMDYNAMDFENFSGTMDGSVNPQTDLQSSNTFLYRLLDSIGLGFIHKLFTTIDFYMYGFVNVLSSIFGTWLGPELTSFVFGWLKFLIFIGYVFLGLYLWTGKQVA